MKLQSIAAIIILSGILAACGYLHSNPTSTPEEITRAFLSNYEPFCGNTYLGKSQYTNLGEDHPLDDANLTMIITHCSADEVRIRFFVEDDTSRTWILGYLENGLRLAHDHRNSDGTEYEANFYGGIAMNNEPAAFEHYPPNMHPDRYTLYFPADARTLSDRPSRSMNVWSKSFDLQEMRYYYRLFLNGELRYEAAFDLSTPVVSESMEIPDADLFEESNL
jgi:hypothetical protein